MADDNWPKTVSATGNPAATIGSRASNTARADAVAGMVASVVTSPPPTSSASAHCTTRRISSASGASTRTACQQKEAPEKDNCSRTGVLGLHPAHSEANQFRGGVHLQFGFDVHAMHFDGLDAQVQLLGNLPGAFALADELKDFKLAVRQILDRRPARFGAAAGKDFQNPGGHFFADGDLAAEHLADGLQQFHAAFLFHDVTAA